MGNAGTFTIDLITVLRQLDAFLANTFILVDTVRASRGIVFGAILNSFVTNSKGLVECVLGFTFITGGRCRSNGSLTTLTGVSGCAASFEIGVVVQTVIAPVAS
jgi:hypothetical protein